MRSFRRAPRLIVEFLYGSLLTLSLTLVATAQSAQPGDWLTMSPPDNWNTSGANVPPAPPVTGNPDPRCGTQERAAESPEEEQVVAAGWRLFNAARVGWGLRVIDGLASYDGMCRPDPFQAFVFADGVFAGTISPAPMRARTDGSGRVLDVRGPDLITTQFVRYTAADPLCCPSSTYVVELEVDRGDDGGGPLLVPTRSTPVRQ